MMNTKILKLRKNSNHNYNEYNESGIVILIFVPKLGTNIKILKNKVFNTYKSKKV